MGPRNACACGKDRGCREKASDRIVMVGSPNVGKSALFNRLTGSYVVVSNYPGTTVEVSRGRCQIADKEYEIEDTPGMYSLLPITEEERVARDILLCGGADVVLHVIDAKNLKRMLSLTLQLLEANLPVVLVLNIIDEARSLGIRIDNGRLQEMLGIPVVAISALSGEGIDSLKEEIARAAYPRTPERIDYGKPVEAAIEAIVPLLPESGLSRRAQALLLLQGDPHLRERSCPREGIPIDTLQAVLSRLEARIEEPVSCLVPMAQHRKASEICEKVFTTIETRTGRFAKHLGEWTMNPVTGIPILILVLYFGLYEFVGKFGAGVLVDLLETEVFESHLIPWVNDLAAGFIPWESIRELVAMDYGIVTLGLRYAVAIILPIVSTFFLAFSVIEDTGYLPRLAMMVDFVFKRIGLNGRAVIPMTLGFGCDTMATMVTRTLETGRERLIATLLLALAIPCSAQLGVILSLMAEKPAAVGVWTGVVLGIFLFIGYLTARLMPGDRPNFYMELPPLRLPRPGAVFMKTYSRMHWYFMEILPLFMAASVLIWLGKITRTFDLLVSGLSHVMSWIGLPPEAAVAFLFGFFRRDYGAAGLHDLQSSGLLTGNQLAVAGITLTLFIPCIAQFMIMKKERGLKTACGIALFIVPFSFFIGGMVNAVLHVAGIEL